MSRQRLSNHSNEEYVARFRTEVCAEYVAGECVFSADECFQTHGKVPQRRKPFRNGFKEHCYSPVLCLFYPKCCSGAKCPLAHGKMEEDYHPKNFRKVTCRFAAKTLPGGACPIRGPHCSFAHSEIRSPEGTAQNGMSERSTPAAEEELWVVRTYKTEQCDVRSEAQCPRGAHCSRFHTPFERRRNPFKISYGPRRCAFRWEDPYTLNCPAKDSCVFAHNAVEMLYHPAVYKAMLCECHEAVGVCGRGDLCEKAHGEAELIRLRAAKELGNTKTADGAKLADLFFLRMPPATAALQPEDLSGRSLRFDFSELPPADGYSSAEAAELRAAAASAAERCAAASALLSERLCGLAAAAMERVAAETKAGRRTACTEAQRLHLAAQRMAAERTELEQRVRCPACLQRDRAVALVPCGHVFCASCADGVRRCLFCQEKVSQKVVLKTQFSEVIKKG